MSTGAVASILIIDDEPQIRRFLGISLVGEGYRIEEAGTGAAGLGVFSRSPPDLVILDLGLPDMDGNQVIRNIRSGSQVPIVVLSVRLNEVEKVAALDAGANDYVTKPFGIRELLARIRALLRTPPSSTGKLTCYEIGSLMLDQEKHLVQVDGKTVHLTKKEFELLALLMQHAGKVVSHPQILRALWGSAHQEDSQYLRVYIGQLRRKLGDDPAAPRFIANEPWVGYRLIAGDPDV